MTTAKLDQIFPAAWPRDAHEPCAHSEVQSAKEGDVATK